MKKEIQDALKLEAIEQIRKVYKPGYFNEFNYPPGCTNIEAVAMEVEGIVKALESCLKK